MKAKPALCHLLKIHETIFEKYSFKYLFFLLLFLHCVSFHYCLSTVTSFAPPTSHGGTQGISKCLVSLTLGRDGGCLGQDAPL